MNATALVKTVESVRQEHPQPPQGDFKFEFLEQIPSETTLGERRFLFDLFANRWNGHGNVVEIGPFLGGTTRAIACGMERNHRVSAEVLLHTYDRFDVYYSAEQLRVTIEPLVRNGSLEASQADALCRTADFERLFTAIHSPHAYARRVRLHNSPLPDLPEEIDGSSALNNLEGQDDLGALFIDGCKSWAATHYAMKFLLPRTRVNAPVIFQDYGWYTCFWITAATYALREFLEAAEHVDGTYEFRLKRSITTADVTGRFARTPAEMGDTFFRESAAALIRDSVRIGDVRGELIAKLHHVAALVTLDRRADAAKILNALDVRRYTRYADMIRGCIKSPTYLPGGKPLLWKQAA